MQEFPIIGPLVGTFEGGIGAKLDLRLGYDTQGLADFIASKNPAALIDGFFFDTKDAERPANPLPVATLTAEIAVGAAIDLAPDQGGRRGRHHGDDPLHLGRPEQGRQGPPRRAEVEPARQRRRPAGGLRHLGRARSAS